MKKVIVVLCLTLALGGCASLQQAFNAYTSASASIANPVTPQMLYNVENTAIVAFAGLKAYKQSCVAKALPSSCRGIVQQLQTYTRKLPALLTNLRSYIGSNDQISAVSAYNEIQQLISNFKSVATNNGLGGV